MQRALQVLFINYTYLGNSCYMLTITDDIQSLMNYNELTRFYSEKTFAGR